MQTVKIRQFIIKVVFWQSSLLRAELGTFGIFKNIHIYIYIYPSFSLSISLYLSLSLSLAQSLYISLPLSLSLPPFSLSLSFSVSQSLFTIYISSPSISLSQSLYISLPFPPFSLSPFSPSISNYISLPLSLYLSIWQDPGCCGRVSHHRLCLPAGQPTGGIPKGHLPHQRSFSSLKLVFLIKDRLPH